MNEIIDIVILWVDDNDQNWKSRKEIWQEKYGIKSKMPERYRDWENIQYLFRGIEKYASWVNHVYLVTDNQIPDWLDTSNKKVSIVDHTEIIDVQFLPTFNSQAIEVNVHKIKGISEKFIYFNDDIFIINNVKPDDFFYKGLPRDFAISNVVVPDIRKPITYPVFNNLSIINNEFDKLKAIKNWPFNWFNFKYGILNFQTFLLNFRWKGFTGFYEPHAAQSYLKSTFEEVWEKYPNQMLRTTKSKFRENDNCNQWIFRYWQLASNRFHPRSPKFSKVFDLPNIKAINKCEKHIISQKSKIVCVNDGETLKDFDYAKNTINQALHTLFPKKSKFEKQCINYSNKESF